MVTNQKQFIRIVLLALVVLSFVAAIACAEQALDSNEILRTAVISNGKSIYDTGKREKGAHMAFTGGPYWLHVDGGGCAKCHGKRGWGSVVPTDCNSKTTPITFKYLAGNGYPFSAREDGTHPVYTTYTFKVLMRSGLKPNGYEADYCMPRYFISNDEIRDLLGYLIELDKD